MENGFPLKSFKYSIDQTLTNYLIMYAILNILSSYDLRTCFVQVSCLAT